MKNCLFKGICTALVTPFADGKINFSMLKKLIERQIEAGIPAIVICGTTGEASTLSDAEKTELIHAAKEFSGDKCRILAGTGSNCTEHAVKLSKEAEAQGADGLLIVTPYYNKCTRSGLIRHYETIADSVSLPIILYNVPSRTCVDIPTNVCQELSQIPNITGIKEASPDLKKITELIQLCPEGFSVYSGNDDLLLPILSLGGNGCISVTSNVRPEAMKKVTDLFFSGDLLRAKEGFMKLQPLMKALFSEVNPIPIKAAMKEIGFDCGSCRLPLTNLSQENLFKLRELL